MPIEALPATTACILGSSQVLSSPASLVKEMIDNALDAKASTIGISISANTIDKIEVRDNGHGIAREDLPVLGRRGYTSKLKAFDDLRVVGGVSLGFRGEALASATELGQVSVTTRTEGEAVAAIVKLKPGGGTSSQTSTSHPPGTTVSVLKLFYDLPVRKQHAMKEATKQLARIKELIQDYALARLSVKISLKVLKMDKGSWTFFPRPNDGIREAVAQVIGRDGASQCIEKHAHREGSSHVALTTNDLTAKLFQSQGRQASLSPGFVVQAFIPRSTADWSKIGGGPHMSIDSRPVSAKRGTPRKIISQFKTYLRNAHGGAVPDKIRDPFIRLNIICPVGSYDPNVEPSKDVVLFEDESILLDAVLSIFKSVYGDLTPRNDLPRHSLEAGRKAPEPLPAKDGASSPIQKALPYTSPTGRSQNLGGDSPDEIQIVMTPQSSRHVPTNVGDRGVVLHSRTQRKADLNASKDVNEDLPPDRYGVHIPTALPGQDNHSNSNSRNPWILAKMNVPSRRMEVPSSTAKSVPKILNPFNPSRTALDMITAHRASKYTSVSPYPTPPGTRHHDGPGVDISKTSLEAWIETGPSERDLNTQRMPPATTPMPDDLDQEMLLTEDSDLDQRAQTNDSILLGSPGSHSALHQRVFVLCAKDLNKPFKCPVQKKQPIPSSACQPEPITHIQSTPSLPHSGSAIRLIEPGIREISYIDRSEVEDALDYERRKDEATKKRRAMLQASGPVRKIIRTSPHGNRYNAAVAALEMHRSKDAQRAPELEAPPLTTNLSDGDSRAYLMRWKASMAIGGSMLKRTKTLLLPLETVREDARLQNLIQTISIHIDDISNALDGLSRVDKYAESGNLNRGLDSSAGDTSDLHKRLDCILGKRLYNLTGEDHDIMINLKGLHVGQ
ncbi:MAG: hypothetical protein M1818_003390 [Claussenomyces sp. TS43310]|nr:MAG: hypothetical protein M1818_003390 [Claussenomyces sp. TS43310]